MGTLQENQKLNAEYERNKKEREMQQEIDRLNNIINELEKWLKEHSIIDYSCSDVILHEQMALNAAFEYLQILKENK